MTLVDHIASELMQAQLSHEKRMGRTHTSITDQL